MKKIMIVIRLMMVILLSLTFLTSKAQGYLSTNNQAPGFDASVTIHSEPNNLKGVPPDLTIAQISLLSLSTPVEV